MEEHNRLVKLAENDFQDMKSFEARILEQKDVKDFLSFAILLLHEAKAIEEELRKPWGGYDPSKPNEFLNRRYLVVKRSIFLGIGTEYLLKTIFLGKGFSINRTKRGIRLQEPYKLSGNFSSLDPKEAVTFEYLKTNLDKVVDCSKFDEEVRKENEKRYEKDEKLKEKNGDQGFLRYNYKKPDSNGCLNFIQGVRNNYAHNAFIKAEFGGFFFDAFEFLNFLTEKTFRKSINEIYDEIKAEGKRSR